MTGSFSGFSTSSAIPQPTAPTVAHIAVKEERRRDMVFKVNGQKLTAVRDVNIQMNSHNGNLAEVSIELSAEPNKLITGEGLMDITTYGYDALGLPPVMKQLQKLSDEVHNLAEDVGRISRRDYEMKAVDAESEKSNLEGTLWSYIIGKIDEKALTQWIGLGMDNLNIVELIQFLKPLVEQYKQILTDGLKQVKI